MKTTFETMPISQLRPHPKNVRHEVGDVQELAASIKQQGLLQPIVVAPSPTLDGDYVMVSGHRRHAAARKAGLHEVPVIIRHDLNADDKIIAAMLVENLQRSDLTVIEEAEGYQALLDFGEWTPAKVAKSTGTTAKRVKERLPLSQLPDAQKKQVIQQELPISKAAKLAPFVDYPELYESVLAAAQFDSTYFEHRVKDAEDRLRFEQEDLPRLTKMVEDGWAVEYVEDEAEFEYLYEINQASEDDLLADPGSARAIKAVKENWPEAILVVGAPRLELAEIQEDVFWYVGPERTLAAEQGEPDPDGATDHLDDRVSATATKNLTWQELQDWAKQLQEDWTAAVDEVVSKHDLSGITFAVRGATASLDVRGLMPAILDLIMQIGYDNDASGRLLDLPDEAKHRYSQCGLWSDAIEKLLASDIGYRFEHVLRWLYRESLPTGSPAYWEQLAPSAWNSKRPTARVSNVQTWLTIREQVLGIPPQEAELELIAKATEIFKSPEADQA